MKTFNNILKHGTQVEEIGLWIEFLLLFKKSKYTGDFAESYDTFVRYKELRGKIYILETVYELKGTAHE